jgi:hypothetical protein
MNGYCGVAGAVRNDRIGRLVGHERNGATPKLPEKVRMA